MISGTVVAVWRKIDEALTPIVGVRGVAALHGRSRFLASQTCPWIGGRLDGVQMTMDLESLRLVLAEQPAGDALLGATTLLEAFHDVLSTMVGIALTERLLRTVWDIPNGGHAAQDRQL